MVQEYNADPAVHGILVQVGWPAAADAGHWKSAWLRVQLQGLQCVASWHGWAGLDGGCWAAQGCSGQVAPRQQDLRCLTCCWCRRAQCTCAGLAALQACSPATQQPSTAAENNLQRPRSLLFTPCLRPTPDKPPTNTNTTPRLPAAAPAQAHQRAAHPGRHQSRQGLRRLPPSQHRLPGHARPRTTLCSLHA